MKSPKPRRNSLEWWQQRVGKPAPSGETSAEHVWLQLVEEAAEIARPVRTRQFDRLKDGGTFAAPLLSLVRFACVMDFDLAEATWSKFPAVCPYCVNLVADVDLLAGLPTPDLNRFRALEPCACPPPPKYPSFEPEADWMEPFRARRDMRPAAVGDWQAMFSDLYAHRHGTDLDALAYHFIEEIGEVAGALRHRRLQELSFEAADVLSWILSLASTAGRRLGLKVDVEGSMAAAFRALQQAGS